MSFNFSVSTAVRFSLKKKKEKMEKQQYYNVIFRRAEKGRHDIHAELNSSRALTDQVSREKVLEKEKEEFASF